MFGWGRGLVPSASIFAAGGLVAGARVARCDDEDEGDYLDPAFEQSFGEREMDFPDEADSVGMDANKVGNSTVGVADLFNVDVGNVARGLAEHQQQLKDTDFLLAAETGQKNQRPWGEKMTFYTGCALLSGGSMGALYGTYDGYVNAKGSSRRIVVNSIFNQAGLLGTKLSNKFGVLALMYSSIGALSSYIRDEDDHITSMGVAALTGAIISRGTPQQRAVTIASTTAGLSIVNWADAYQRENSAKTYARQGRAQRLQRAMQ